MFFFCFCSHILCGDPLSQRLLFRGTTESLQHTHIQLHTTQSPAITDNQVLLYTHTVWSVAALFFQVIQGCRAGFEPKTSHNSCLVLSLKLPLSHPCTLMTFHINTIPSTALLTWCRSDLWQYEDWWCAITSAIQEGYITLHRTTYGSRNKT